MSGPQVPPGPDGDGRGGGHPPAFNVPPATLALAIILIAVFALLHLLPGNSGATLGQRLSFNAAMLLAALDGTIALSRALPQLVTHMFVHLDAMHLAVNVGFLLAFASVVERRLGRAAFVVLFLACGVAGALCETWFLPDPETLAIPMIGASGGIMGLMGTALLVAAPPAGAAAGVPARARPALLRVVVALVALNVVIGLMSEMGWTGPYLIGWRAHLGGFALGLLVGCVLRFAGRRGK